jgi:hypothetical protein
MRDEVRFHRWLLRTEEHKSGPASRLADLCRHLGMDLVDLGLSGRRPEMSDYQEALLGALTAAWMEVEVFSNGGGQEGVAQAAKAIGDALVPEAEASMLLRSAWRSWLLYLQRADRVQGGG